MIRNLLVPKGSRAQRFATGRHFFCAPLLALFTWMIIVVADARAVTVPTVPVGNAGNAADQNYLDQGQFGAVAYAYRMGTTEVTNSQYAEFLNAKAASDPFELYDLPSMGVGNVRGGITRSGVNGSYTYALKPNMGDKPVIAVNWYDAIRFANWLSNGQGSGDTETGSYTLGPLGPRGVPINRDVVRNAGATWVLPSENEWYKAAYYQPAAQGGDVDNYWLFPTASNSVPTLATADAVGDISNPGPNVANTQRGANWNGSVDRGNITTVGSAGPLSRSFYPAYTAKRLPIRLVFSEQYSTLEDAVTRERQLKGWSRAKKAVLVAGDREGLQELSKRRANSTKTD